MVLTKEFTLSNLSMYGYIFHSIDAQWFSYCFLIQCFCVLNCTSNIQLSRLPPLCVFLMKFSVVPANIYVVCSDPSQEQISLRCEKRENCCSFHWHLLIRWWRSFDLLGSPLQIRTRGSCSLRADEFCLSIKTPLTVFCFTYKKVISHNVLSTGVSPWMRNLLACYWMFWCHLSCYCYRTFFNPIEMHTELSYLKYKHQLFTRVVVQLPAETRIGNSCRHVYASTGWLFNCYIYFRPFFLIATIVEEDNVSFDRNNILVSVLWHAHILSKNSFRLTILHDTTAH